MSTKLLSFLFIYRLIAGNVVIGAGLFVWIQFAGAFAPLGQLSVASGPFLERLLMVNIILVVFNMLPAFPMDGGRVLRALLATRIEYARATQIAANIGQAMALLFAFVGFFVNPFLIFIAFFVWIGATQEASMATIKSALGGIPVKRAMMTDFSSLKPSDTLQRAIDLVLATPQQDFPVVEDSIVVGNPGQPRSQLSRWPWVLRGNQNRSVDWEQGNES